MYAGDGDISRGYSVIFNSVRFGSVRFGSGYFFMNAELELVFRFGQMMNAEPEPVFRSSSAFEHVQTYDGPIHLFAVKFQCQWVTDIDME